MVCWVVGHHILHPWPLSTSSPTSATVTITLSCHSPCGLPRGTFTVTWCHEDDWGRGLRLQRQRHWGWWSLAGGPCLHSLSLRKPRMKEHHCTHRHIPSTHTCRQVLWMHQRPNNCYNWINKSMIGGFNLQQLLNKVEQTFSAVKSLR